VSISKHIKFGTVEALSNMKTATLLAGIKHVYDLCKARGLHVTGVFGDGQFECLRPGITELGAALNVAAPEEHVPDVERYIRTIKERARAIVNTLPFNSIPSIMTTRLIS
jgi:hypothetical protein